MTRHMAFTYHFKGVFACRQRAGRSARLASRMVIGPARRVSLSPGISGSLLVSGAYVRSLHLTCFVRLLRIS